MNENIDLTKILDGCPVGTVFYSTIFGKVSLMGVHNNADLPIVIITGQGLMGLTSDGRYFSQYDGECTLFPSKDQRDWSKFERFWDKKSLDKSVAEKFDPKTLQPFDKVLARDFLSDDWMADFFEKIEKNNIHYNVSCVTSKWIQCIPYNKETKHLLGTRKECPEYYKWWKECL